MVSQDVVRLGVGVAYAGHLDAGLNFNAGLN